MDAEQKVIAGGVVAALSLIAAGILIGARILGITVAYGGYFLILCAVFVVLGVIILNHYSGGIDDVSV